MKCPRCLNEDPAYFYHGTKGWYCRKCIRFGRLMIEEDQKPISFLKPEQTASTYCLTYPLTPEQKELSEQVIQNIAHTDILLQCVCGAGKTEITVPVISALLQQRKKICFAIARRQVVLELAERLGNYFPNASVTAVCGGHTQITDGDLIVCTTHQLYRYYQAFDLLILDEPDAYPFAHDPVLHNIARTACKGHCLYLTATPDETLQTRVKKGDLFRLCLHCRPHRHPLPVPIIKTGPTIYLFPQLIRWLRTHSNHPRMVFVPSIQRANILAHLLSIFTPCYLCTSKTADRDEVIAHFRQEPHAIIIATTVLERGVTIPRADICVYQADHAVFDLASLVQMAGRAGRTFQYPTGDVLFLCRKPSKTVQECKESIEGENTWLTV